MKNVINIFILVILILFIISFILLFFNTGKIEGDALSGYKEENNYYINSGGSFKEVSKIQWYYNYILWIFTLTVGIITAIGFVYFIIRYVLPFVIAHSYPLKKTMDT